MFRDGWAWCQPCVMIGLHCEPWIAQVLESDSMRECCTNISGLRFYTPGSLPTEAMSAYERFEATGAGGEISVTPDERDGLYLITPAGEVAIEKLDVGPLHDVEYYLKRHRDRQS